MHSRFIHEIFDLVAQLGPLAYWLIFLISFFEALAFVGLIFPGASLIIFAGFLSSRGGLDPMSVIFFAFLGALLGDNLSFWAGKKSSRFIKNNKFSSRYIIKGCAFLEKYKAESILIARFVGPVRAIVPSAAGTAKFPFRTFFLWNAASVALWAISHVLLGHFFGASLALLRPWIRRTHSFLLFTIAFFSFFYFGKKILVYYKQKQLFNSKKIIRSKK